MTTRQFEFSIFDFRFSITVPPNRKSKIENRKLVAGFLIGMMVIGMRTHVASAAVADAAIRAKASGANEAYRQSHYDEAILTYQAILDSGVESGPLYYNLGNAFLKNGRTSEALWAYLKANALMPRDPDLAANLSYTRSLHVTAESVSVRASGMVPWLTFGGLCSIDELSTMMLVCFWVAVIAWMLAGWMPRARAFMRPTAWLASIATAALLTALIVQTVWVEDVPRAVTIGKSVEVKFAPQESGTLHFALPEGAVVRVLGRQFGWVQVARADGKSGWMKEDGLKE